MSGFTKDIRSIRGIGEKRAQAFHRLGVNTLLELISFFPMRYEDRSRMVPIAEAVPGESVCIAGLVRSEPRLERTRGGRELVKFTIVDDSGSMEMVFFNQPYIRKQIHRGQTLHVFGKVDQFGGRRSMINPMIEDEAASAAGNGAIGRICPQYHLTAGLTNKTVMQSIRLALDSSVIPECLPPNVRSSRPDVRTAYENIHFPESWEALTQARERFAYEELFILSCAMESFRREDQSGIVLSPVSFDRFFSMLPFSPTSAQRKAVQEASQDLCSGKRMNRLLQGDVGSGKTLVAAALIWQCMENGKRAAFMAPTELLAEQHYQTLTGLLTPLGVRVALATGSMRTTQKDALRESLSAGEYDLVIGTHALLNLHIPELTLAITDEQHRFGVQQRAALSSSGMDAGEHLSPHVLVMSATPIPRTLSLLIFGDLDVSVLDERPAGRQKVDTFCVSSAYHNRLLAFIQRLCGEGRQVFVVCPRIKEEKAEDDAEEPAAEMKSAVEYSLQLSHKLPGLQVSCLHGQMKSSEKERIMSDFLRGGIQVLVSTTVIEVGIDVPNAALILIENAERFGLSQLHQLRGRVGRGRHKSYCVLVTDNTSEDVQRRMKVMCETDDGFRLAEEDLRLRGPGDFFGARQHGLPQLHVADLGTDLEMLLRARQDAKQLLSEDPTLQSWPVLKQRIDLMLENAEGTLN